MFSPPTPSPEPPPTAPEPEPEPEAGHPTPLVPPHPLADGTPRRLDPRYVPCARLAGWVWSLIVLAAGPAVLGVLGLAAEAGALQLALLAAAWLALLALSIFMTVSFPQLKYRHLTWRLSPAGLEIRRGVVFRHVISVPRARVQHTDVARGPIERRFDLASLVVHTAGHQDSEVTLEGLEHGTALAIRDYLLAGGDHHE